ncbi:MAG: CHAT domain-containing tetratricopeptide repeat protein [Acidobacteriota bacterium]
MSLSSLPALASPAAVAPIPPHRGHRSSGILICALWLVLLTGSWSWGCSPPSTPKAEDSRIESSRADPSRTGNPAELCQHHLEVSELPQALSACEAAYSTTGAPATALGAARAAYGLGELDAAIGWAQRLRSTPLELDGAALEASAELARGESTAAAEAYRRALQGARLAQRPRLQAWSLHGLAYLAWESSDYRRALLLATRARVAAQEAGALDLERLSNELLHSVLYAVGDFEAAEGALSDLESVIRRERQAGAENLAEESRLLYHRANLYLDGDRPALAEVTLQRALDQASTNDPGGQLEARFYRSAWLNLTRLALDAGDAGLARERWLAALRYAPEEQSRGVAVAYYGARLELAEGEPRAAARRLRQALEHAPPADWRWDLEHQLGRALEAQGHLKEAGEAYRRAIAEVEELRRSLGFDSFRPSLLARRREPYESLFLLEARRGRWAPALDAAEGARARSFLDAFIAAGSPAGPTAETRAESAAGDDRGSGRELSPVRLGWAGSRLEGLESLAQGLASSPVSAPRPAEELRRALGPQPLLSYFTAADQLWVLVQGHRPPTLRQLRLPVPLAQAVDALTTDPRGAVARQLGPALLPADLLPAPGSTLLIVPDGPLGRLPFSALMLEDGRYLVERNALAFVPSLSAAAALAQRSAAEGRRQPQRAIPARVLGDPRSDLPAAAREAQAVAEHLGVSPFLQQRATAGALLDLPQGSVLHLAAHTGLGAGGPWIALADGPLPAHRLLDMESPPRLAVLATCGAAAGEDFGGRGRGLEGSLGAAFLAARTPSVLAALASVEDEPTRRLVQDFYSLGGVQRPAAALAEAQRRAAGAGEPPQVWGPFALFGWPGES